MKSLNTNLSICSTNIMHLLEKFIFSKSTWISILVLFFTLPALGQTKYQVSGKIIDKRNEEPVPYAQVALYAPGRSQPVTGAITEDDGEFSLQAKAGKYDLSIVFVGYEDKRISVNLNDSKQLGSITILPSTQQLEEVVVKSDQIRRPISTDLEGLTIRPDQTISNVGGSLLDVLRNTPSVSVSDDGTVTIRGSSGTNVLIDGRNSALTSDLEQIPASLIENIKIVNNPNAKYDAQGAGGVINIQLKRGEGTGTTGKAEVTVGTRMRLNSSVRLSHRSDQFNVFGGYSFRRWPRVGYSSTTRETFDDNQRLEQFGDRERQDTEHTFNFGGDYFFGKNKLSYEGVVNFEDESDTDLTTTQVFNTNTEDLLLQYVRQNNEIEDNHTLDNALIYERLFDNKDQEFRILVSNSYRNQLENQFINVFSGSITPDTGEPTGEERSTNDEANATTIIQADYVHPFSNGKLEVGYKSTFRKLDNDYRYEVLDQSTNLWENQTNVSNRFLYKDQIHAVYAIYSHKFEKFDLSVGTRAEQTLVNTKLFTTNEENEQSYLNLFPSLQAQYHINDINALKFTYSRRIDRPGSWWLNPFPDISDSLNVRIGNPNIQPEFIHSLEFGHTISFKKADITSNIFYRHVDGQVDYIVSVEDGISYRQPTNLSTSQTYGLEIINTTEVFSWWNFNASYSIFQTAVDGTNLDAGFTNKGLSWNAKLTTDFSLPFDIDLQLTGNYTAPEIEAQGRDLARYYVDASLQRSFFNDKGSVSLSFRDVFDTRNFSGENFGENFSQTFEYKRESQIVLLSLSYSL